MEFNNQKATLCGGFLIVFLSHGFYIIEVLLFHKKVFMSINKLLDEYFAGRSQILKVFGYNMPFQYAIEDVRECYWQFGRLTGYLEVYFADVPITEKLIGEDDYCINQVLTAHAQQDDIVPQFVFKTEKLTLLVVDTHHDGNRLFKIFSNDRCCEPSVLAGFPISQNPVSELDIGVLIDEHKRLFKEIGDLFDYKEGYCSFELMDNRKALWTLQSYPDGKKRILYGTPEERELLPYHEVAANRLLPQSIYSCEDLTMILAGIPASLSVYLRVYENKNH